jgi:hypothetical protein
VQVIRFEGPNEMRAKWDAEQNYEYLWEGSDVLSSNKTRIATHVIRWNYGDMLLANRSGSQYGYRGPALTFDFNTQKLYNQSDVERYAKELVYWSTHRGSVYRNNRHLAVWGSDFQFTSAGNWFEQMDLLVNEINQHPHKYNATIQYTTLSEYFDFIHSLDEALPVKRGLDFEFAWPHSWSPTGVPLIGLTSNFSWQYQTGATSSRHQHKKNIRHNAALLRTAQAAYACAHVNNVARKNVTQFQLSWDALGVMQHHDSMPGTMRTKDSVECPDNIPINAIFDDDDMLCPREQDPNRHVLKDYTQRLAEAHNNTMDLLMSSLESIENFPVGTLHTTTMSHSGSRDRGLSDGLLVFNPSSTVRTELMHMEFIRPKNAPTNLLPTLYLMKTTTTKTAVLAQIEVNDRLYSQNTASHVAPPTYSEALYFLAENVQPWSSLKYQLLWNEQEDNSTTTTYPQIINTLKDIRLGFDNSKDLSQCVTVEFQNAQDTLASSISTGCLDTTKNQQPKTTIAYRQTYKQYLDGSGGAYCLIEQSSAIEIVLPYYVHQTKGSVMQEVIHRYSYGAGLTQRTRLIKNDPTVHVLHEGGRLPSDRELISSIQTDVQNTQDNQSKNGDHNAVLPVLYTEASGCVELYERVFNATSSIAQNYHSMVQTAVVKDAKMRQTQQQTEQQTKQQTEQQTEQRQLTVMTRRTMGVASLSLGAVEYMLMRRFTFASDDQGPWPLDDKTPMQEEHMRVMVNNVNLSETNRFHLAMEHEHPMTSLYYSVKDSVKDSSLTFQNYNDKTFASPPSFGSVFGLPNNVWSEILVRQHAPLNETYMLRLQYVVSNIDGMDSEDITMSTISLAGILSPWKVVSCQEMTLTLQERRATNNNVRLHWIAENEENDTNEVKEEVFGCNVPLTLVPLEIRTFVFGILSTA